MGVLAGAPPGAMTPAFNNQTIVQVVRLSAGGRQLRLRLSNEYSGAPLVIGRVSGRRAEWWAVRKRRSP